MPKLEERIKVEGNKKRKGKELTSIFYFHTFDGKTLKDFFWTDSSGDVIAFIFDIEKGKKEFKIYSSNYLSCVLATQKPFQLICKKEVFSYFEIFKEVVTKYEKASYGKLEALKQVYAAFEKFLKFFISCYKKNAN